MATEEARLDNVRHEPAAGANDRTAIDMSPAGFHGDFGAHSAGPQPFAGLGEFLQTVRRSSEGAKVGEPADPRLLSIREWGRRQAAATGSNETVGSEGGFLVQPSLSNELLTSAFQTGVLAAKCRPMTVPLGANGIKLNIPDEASRATGSRWGGLKGLLDPGVGRWHTGEAEVRPDRDGAQEAHGDLVRDRRAARRHRHARTGRLRGIRQRVRLDVGRRHPSGTGVGPPLGILNSPALITVPKETGRLRTPSSWKTSSRCSPGCRQV